MKQTTRQLLIAITLMLFSIPVQAQLLAGDPQFPIINEIQWETNREGVTKICEKKGVAVHATDSTLVFQTEIFNTSAKAKIQFGSVTQTPIMVNVMFDESTEPMRDTLIHHFTITTGKKPVFTTKEKSAVIFTMKIELASWKIGADLVSVIATKGGDSMIGLSMLISPSLLDRKSEH
jgi:hypothetical protein